MYTKLDNILYIESKNDFDIQIHMYKYVCVCVTSCQEKVNTAKEQGGAEALVTAVQSYLVDGKFRLRFQTVGACRIKKISGSRKLSPHFNFSDQAGTSELRLWR